MRLLNIYTLSVVMGAIILSLDLLIERFIPSSLHTLFMFIAIVFTIFLVVGVMKFNSKMLEQELHKERTKLKESKDRYEHLADNLKDRMIFFTHSLDGELIYVSQGFNLLRICSPNEAIGMAWKDIIPWTPESIALAIEHNKKILEVSGYNAPLEMSYINKDGQKHYLLIYEFPIYSHEKKETIIEGVAIDITEQKRQEEDTKILMRAIENTPNSVVITDTDGKIAYVNSSFTKATGYTKEEAIGNNPRVLKSGLHDDNFYKQMWETLSSGATWRGEIANKRKDGRIFWEFASISPIQDEDGNIKNYVAVKDDITDHKELERLKDDVDRIMRHDLKSPLNAIIGFPKVLLTSSNLNENQIKIIKMIESAGKKMLEMIDNSLDMFKMESGTYVYIPKMVDVISVILKIIDQSYSRLSGKDLECKVILNGKSILEDKSEKQTLLILSEERLLYSLLSNLFINAIEASPENDKITFEITEQPAADNFVPNSVGNGIVDNLVVVTLHNKGAVPKSVREYFFEKYKTYGKTSGTGLGTYSAKLLATAMRYKIEMDTSDENNKTTITLLIPTKRV
ncbi:MAG: PAS domain-containing sensor histidine kinase [Desulfamplus sp.]|nr:PAS domain-containing sensor histidine kinase [Desulfamplus sp.]